MLILFLVSELKEPINSFVRACSLCLFAEFSADEEFDLSPFKRSANNKIVVV